MGRFKEKAFWIAFGDFVGRGIGFFTSIYLARILGVEFFGLITLALSILGYATWISDLGLINIGVREIAKDPEKRLFRAKEIFNLKVVLAAIVLLSGTILVTQIPMGPTQKQVILGFLYSLVPYSILIDWYYNGRQRFGSVAASKILSAFTYFVLVFFLVKSQNDITVVPIFYTIGITVSVVFLATISIFEKPFPLPSRGLQIYSELLKSSSILGIGWFFTQVVSLLPAILIAGLIGLNEAGIFGAAFRIIIIAMMLDRIFVNLLLPNLASLWISNRELAKKRIQIVIKIIIIGGGLLSLLISINSEGIVHLLYGNEFSESAAILSILSIFVFLTFLNSLFSFGLIAIDKDREYLLATCFGGTLAAIFVFIFAAFGTLKGVTTAIIIGELILTSFSYFWFNKSVPLSFFKTAFIVSLSAFSIWMIVYFFNLPAIWSSLIAVLVVFGVSRATKLLTVEEIAWLKEKIIK